MKTPFSCYVFLAFALTAQVVGQSRFGRSDPSFGPANPTPTHNPSIGMNTSGSQSSVFVTGKIVLDDGTELTEPAAIQTICKGQKHTETYSDTRGGFSFQFGDPSAGAAASISDATSSNTGIGMISPGRDPRDCQLQAVLAGFTSPNLELSSRANLSNNIDVGRVSLHRLARVEGTSISVTNALAPAPARKALEKGREQEIKGKWDEARKSLEKAVQIYPRYAAAWNELGRLQLRDHDAASARHSFEQALAADPKYVNPYEGLAQLAMQSHDWHNMIEVTGKLLALNPFNFPDAFYYNAVGNYYLGNFDAAEKSALSGIRVDEAHQIPRLQYLLGLMLFQKRDYPAASEHMQLYLRFAAQPADVDLAKKSLAEIEKFSATAKPPVVDAEK
jgi:hypothetical protein